MKNNFIIFILCLLSLNLSGQLLEDRTEFFIGYQQGIFTGNKTFDNQGIIATAFYANLLSNQGAIIKTTTKFLPVLSGGIKISWQKSSDWQSDNSALYSGSFTNSYYFQPVCQIHTPYSSSGIFNKLKLYAEFSPCLGISDLRVMNNIFIINGSDYYNKLFQINRLTYGIEAGTGVEYKFNNNLGVWLQFSNQTGFINSPFFIDNQYHIMNFQTGISISLSKVKRFKY